jgi:hypothetical protein
MAAQLYYPSGMSVEEFRAQLKLDLREVRGRQVVGGAELARAAGTTESVVWATLQVLRKRGTRIGFVFTPLESEIWSNVDRDRIKDRMIAEAKARGQEWTRKDITQWSGPPTSRFALAWGKLRYITPDAMEAVVSWAANELVDACEAGHYDFMRHPSSALGFSAERGRLNAMDDFVTAHPSVILSTLRGRRAKSKDGLMRLSRVYAHAQLMRESLSKKVLREIEGFTPWEDPSEASDEALREGMRRDLPDVKTVGELSDATNSFSGIHGLNMHADSWHEPLGSKRLNAILRSASLRMHLVAITALLESVKVLTKNGLASHPIDQPGLVEACKELATYNTLKRLAESQNEHGLGNAISRALMVLEGSVRMTEIKLRAGWERRDVVTMMQPLGEPYPSLDVITLVSMLLGVPFNTGSNAWPGCKTASDIYRWERKLCEKPWQKTKDFLDREREQRLARAT